MILDLLPPHQPERSRACAVAAARQTPWTRSNCHVGLVAAGCPTGLSGMTPGEIAAFNTGIEVAAWEMDRRAFKVSATLIRARKVPEDVAIAALPDVGGGTKSQRIRDYISRRSPGT